MLTVKKFKLLYLVVQNFGSNHHSRCSFSGFKFTQIDSGWGFAPDPTGGAYSAPPDPLAGLRGPTFKGRDGERREGKGERGRKFAPVPKCKSRRLC